MKSYTIEKAIEKLNEIGISTRLHARPPMGKNVFIIGIVHRYRPEEQIHLWPGMATHAEIATNKRFKQAVLMVHEEGREVVTHTGASRHAEETNLSVLKSGWRNHVTIAFPARTRCLKVEEAGRVRDSYGDDRRRLKFTLKTPTEDRCFLLGHDESGTNTFISLLPEVVASVKEAHDLLLPDGVPKGSIRQGEFFFVPAPEVEFDGRRITKNLGLWSVMTKRKTPKSRGVWSGYLDHISDHVAAELIVDWSNGVQYARGLIENRRHKPRVLDGWYKAIPNNEVPNPTPARAWD